MHVIGEEILVAKRKLMPTTATQQEELLEDHQCMTDKVDQEDLADQVAQENKESESIWDQLKLKKSEVKMTFKT